MCVFYLNAFLFLYQIASFEINVCIRTHSVVCLLPFWHFLLHILSLVTLFTPCSSELYMKKCCLHIIVSVIALRNYYMLCVLVVLGLTIKGDSVIKNKKGKRKYRDWIGISPYDIFHKFSIVKLFLIEISWAVYDLIFLDWGRNLWSLGIKFFEKMKKKYAHFCLQIHLLK